MRHPGRLSDYKLGVIIQCVLGDPAWQVLLPSRPCDNLHLDIYSVPAAGQVSERVTTWHACQHHAGWASHCYGTRACLPPST